jgi:transcriptional regulator with XRE-family HTH domain
MNVIAKVRHQLGYTQSDLASKLGVNLNTVKSWETGRRRPQDAYISMLMTLNCDPTLIQGLKKLRPIYEMVQEVDDYLKQQDHDNAVRFVFHGKSGCGKTTVVVELDEILPSGEGIAENTDLYRIENFCRALDIINDKELAYQNSKHIAFNVLNDDLAASLESNGIKVFHFD